MLDSMVLFAIGFTGGSLGMLMFVRWMILYKPKQPFRQVVD